MDIRKLFLTSQAIVLTAVLMISVIFAVEQLQTGVHAYLLSSADTSIDISIRGYRYLAMALIFFMAIFGLAQYISYQILFGQRKTYHQYQVLLLLLLVRYIIPMLYMRMLVRNHTYDVSQFTLMGIAVYYIYAGLVVMDFIIYWFHLGWQEVAVVKILGLRIEITIREVFSLQVFIMLLVSVMLICRSYMSYKVIREACTEAPGSMDMLCTIFPL